MADTGTNPEELFEQSGISKEEQTEVLERIEQVATENRIQTNPDLFALKDVRSGLLFPILVDAIAVVAVAIAVLVLLLVFRHGQQQMVGISGQFTSVEGKLIRALQQESQQQLLDKDQQIASVKAQLDQVEKQRQQLTANMDAQIQQREQEYKQKIQEEMDAERAQLVKQGVASDTMTQMLATYEAQRKAYYDEQLAEYRKQLEGERASVESQLTQLQDEYQNQIQALQQQRTQIVSQYQQRENQLQSQLEQRTRVLDVARVEAVQNLAAAQSKLQELSQQQQQESAVQDQILGQFENIRASLQNNNSQQALTQIQTLRSYLTDNTVAAISDISRQRQMDLFLLDSLQQQVQSDQLADKSTANLSDDLVLLQKLRDTASQAAQAQKSGDTAQADKLYGDLIAYLPVVANAHTELLTQARDKALQSAADTLTKEEQDRKAQFESLSAKAAAAMHQGNYDDAYADYRQALGLDPAVGASGQQAASELAQLGFVLSAFVGQSNANPSAIAAIRQAGIDEAAQDAAFVAQTKRDASSQQQSLANRIDQLDGQIAQLNADKTNLQQQNSQQVATLNATIRSKDDQITSLQAEVKRLTDFENRLNAMQAEYKSYTQKEDAIFKANGPTALLDGRLALEAFLSSGEMGQLLPDFATRLRRYDDAFQNAGHQAALQDATDIIQTLSGFQTVSQQQAYVDAQIARSANDQTMKDFLTALRQLLK